MKIFSLRKFPVRNKTVLLRVDYNVPIENNKIKDNTKILTSIPTIKFLLKQNCKIIIATHLGRPEGQVIKELRLNVIKNSLKKLFPKENIVKFNDCIGKEIKLKIKNAKTTKIFLLENLRFYEEEQNNHPAFAHSLAELANIYVNESFSVSHRKEASIEAITNFLPSIAGLQFEKEIFYLNKALKPKKPAIWLMGGAKLDKVDLIKQSLSKSNKVLIGGALAFSFLKAKGYKVGLSKVDSTSTIIAKKILKKWSSRKLVLPLDFIVTNKFNSRAKEEIVKFNQIKQGQIALDIGPETIKLFCKHLIKAKTIVWNGPMGYFEWSKYSKGTKEVGRFLGKVNANKIAGGGETSEAIHRFHLTHNLTHISTAGGASLTFLSGKEMPGIKALERSYKKLKP